MGRGKRRSSAKAAGDSARVEERSARGPAAQRVGGEPLDFTRPWLAALLIVVVGLCVYLNSFQGVFVLDDRPDILEDPRIHQLWPITAHLTHGTRPLVNLSLAINYALGGTDEFGYHAFNLAVHLLAGLALFGLVRRTLLIEALRPRFGSQAMQLALIIALIWVVHPLATQAVTYTIQRAESMMGLFYLTTLYCVVRQSQSRRPMLWSVAAVAACALGLGSKAVMITAPVVVVLYDRAFLSPSFSQLWRRRWGLYLGLAAMWVIPLSTGLLVAVLNPDRAGGTVGLGYRGFTPWQYAQSQPGVILHYLSLAIWPGRLCLDYWWPIATDAASVALPGMVLLALLIATGWALWRRPKVGFVAASFFIILSPTSSFVPIQDLAFEHRMYLPLAAVVTLVVFGVWRLLQRMARQRNWSPSFRRAIGTAAVVIVVLALSVRTIARNADYHRPEQMWQKVLDLRPSNPRAYNGMGIALADLGDHKQAEKYYRQGLDLLPTFGSCHYNLGNSLYELGRYQEAIECYHAARQYKNRYAEAWGNEGYAHRQLGDLEQARHCFEEAIKLNPQFAKAYNGLGLVFDDLKEPQAAIEQFQQAIKIEPHYAKAHTNLGRVLASLDRVDEAIDHHRQAIEADPQLAEAYNNLGCAYDRRKDWQAAMIEFQRALEVDPDFRIARDNLEQVQTRLEQPAETVQRYQDLLKANPKDVPTRRQLAGVLLQANRLEEAADQLQIILKQEPERAGVYNDLGAIHARLGHTEQAQAYFAQALEKDPDYLAARQNLAIALLELGPAAQGDR